MTCSPRAELSAPAGPKTEAQRGCVASCGSGAGPGGQPRARAQRLVLLGRPPRCACQPTPTCTRVPPGTLSGAEWSRAGGPVAAGSEHQPRARPCPVEPRDSEHMTRVRKRRSGSGFAHPAAPSRGLHDTPRPHGPTPPGGPTQRPSSQGTDHLSRRVLWAQVGEKGAAPRLLSARPGARPAPSRVGLSPERRAGAHGLSPRPRGLPSHRGWGRRTCWACPAGRQGEHLAGDTGDTEAESWVRSPTCPPPADLPQSLSHLRGGAPGGSLTHHLCPRKATAREVTRCPRPVAAAAPRRALCRAGCGARVGPPGFLPPALPASAAPVSPAGTRARGSVC